MELNCTLLTGVKLSGSGLTGQEFIPFVAINYRAYFEVVSRSLKILVYFKNSVFLNFEIFQNLVSRFLTDLKILRGYVSVESTSIFICHF